MKGVEKKYQIKNSDARAERIRKTIAENPTETSIDLSKRLNVTPDMVNRIRIKMGVTFNDSVLDLFSKNYLQEIKSINDMSLLHIKELEELKKKKVQIMSKDGFVKRDQNPDELASLIMHQSKLESGIMERFVRIQSQTELAKQLANLKEEDDG